MFSCCEIVVKDRHTVCAQFVVECSQ